MRVSLSPWLFVIAFLAGGLMHPSLAARHQDSIAPPVASQIADPPAPSVSLKIRAPARQALGEDLQYTYLIENLSAASAHHVFVRGTLPAQAKLVRANPQPVSQAGELVWKLDTLEPGAKREIVVVIKPSESCDIAHCARLQYEHGQCVTTKILKPGLTVEKTGPSQALLGDTVSFKLTVNNTGEADLTGVYMSDMLPVGLEHETGRSSLTWEVGDLAAGQSQSIDYALKAKKTGKLCGKILAYGSANTKDEKEYCLAVTEPKLVLSLTAPKKKYLSNPAPITIVLRNDGSAPLKGIFLSATVQSPLQVIRSTEGGEFDGRQVAWKVGEMLPGGSQTFDLVLQATTAGTHCAKISATAEGGISDAAEACIEFLGVPALSLRVEDTEDPIEIQGATSYNIVVQNPGTLEANQVQITTTMPAHMTLANAQGPSAHHQNGGVITFDPITLPAGGQAAYRIDVHAARIGEAHFRVQLTAKELQAGGPVVQEESTTIYPTLPASLRKARRPSAFAHGIQ